LEIGFNGISPNDRHSKTSAVKLCLSSSLIIGGVNQKGIELILIMAAEGE